MSRGRRRGFLIPAGEFVDFCNKYAPERGLQEATRLPCLIREKLDTLLETSPSRHGSFFPAIGQQQGVLCS